MLLCKLSEIHTLVGNVPWYLQHVPEDWDSAWNVCRKAIFRMEPNILYIINKDQ